MHNRKVNTFLALMLFLSALRASMVVFEDGSVIPLGRQDWAFCTPFALCNRE